MGARIASSRKWLFGWYVIVMSVYASLRICTTHTAMLPGGTSQESTQLNIESLWSGGPFQDPVCGPALHLKVINSSPQSYNGGNSLPSQHSQLAQDMQRIRQTIFSSSSGTIDSTITLSICAKLKLTALQRHRRDYG